ncbi:phosphatidylinositol 3,4,5-trisphosphate-dependent Rac exchanger 2 protein isoform X1 [Ciona intestinalis]
MSSNNGQSSPSIANDETRLTDENKIKIIRAGIMEEIVKRETNYVKILKFAVDKMKTDLEGCADHIEYEIDEGHVRALFGNMPDLLKLHEKLLKKLKTEVESAADLTKPQSEFSIGNIVLQLKDDFQVYDIYCSNYERAEKVAANVLKMASLKKTFQNWLAEMPKLETAITCSVLEFSLKEPLQQICRFSVLLKVLAVFTAPSHKDLCDVIAAYQIAHAALTSIEAGRRSSALKAAYALCDTLQKTWDDRSLCNKSGFLTKRGGSVKSWKIRWFTLRGYELKYFDEPVDERALTTLDLRHCKSVLENDLPAKPHCFGLAFPDRVYYMYAITEEERSEWRNLISWKLYLLAQPAERARLALSAPATVIKSTSDLIKTSTT